MFGLVGAKLATVLFIALGYGWIGGLASGDAQMVKLQNKGLCDDSHYIVTYVPRFKKDSGGVERVQFKVTCKDWENKMGEFKPKK